MKKSNKSLGEQFGYWRLFAIVAIGLAIIGSVINIFPIYYGLISIPALLMDSLLRTFKSKKKEMRK